MISSNVVCATSKGSDQPEHMPSLIRAFASRCVKLLTEHHLEFLRLKGGYTYSYESTLLKCHIVGNHMSRFISWYPSEVLIWFTCLTTGLDNKNFQRKSVNIFLPIVCSKCFGCSKEPSH